MLAVVLFSVSACVQAGGSAESNETASSALVVRECLTDASLIDRLTFASRAVGTEILGRADDWSRQLSDFDRRARQRKLDPTSHGDFLAFLGAAAAEWTPAEKSYWYGHAQRLSRAMAGLNLSLTDVALVKSTGDEEFNFAYARNGAIVLPQDRLAIAGERPRHDFFVLAHEMFHHLSADNPEVRDTLFAMLGFVRFEHFVVPGELEHRRLSNPRAYSYEHALSVQVERGTAHVVPVIQAAIPLEELIMIPRQAPPVLPRLIEVALVPVALGTGAAVRDDKGDVIAYGFDDTDWTARVQRNTSYSIHPEELMADNFALLMEWRDSGVIPPATPGGFSVNDTALLHSVQVFLTNGCGTSSGAVNR